MADSELKFQNGDSAIDPSTLSQLQAWSKQPGQYAALNKAAPAFFQQLGVYNTFQSVFGRDPSAQEMAQFQNLGSDMPSAISSYHSSINNTPSAIAAQQQKQGLDAYNKGQAGFDSTTTAAFKQATGRDPTSDELSHFGGLLATGQIDPYGLSQLVGQTAEAQNKQTAGYQDTLSKNLQATQGDYFKNYINPSILSQTAAAGRDPNSSGVQQAEVQAGKQQNYDLQNYLANFGASQYGQSAQNQQNVYGKYLDQQYGLQNAGISQQLGQQNFLQNQNVNMANYQMQQSAYNQYLSKYGKSSNPIGGALSGASSGAMLGSAGGPWGMGAGAILGGVAGGFAGSKGQGGF